MIMMVIKMLTGTNMMIMMITRMLTGTEPRLQQAKHIPWARQGTSIEENFANKRQILNFIKVVIDLCICVCHHEATMAILDILYLITSLIFNDKSDI